MVAHVAAHDQSGAVVPAETLEHISGHPGWTVRPDEKGHDGNVTEQSLDEGELGLDAVLPGMGAVGLRDSGEIDDRGDGIDVRAYVPEGGGERLGGGHPDALDRDLVGGAGDDDPLDRSCPAGQCRMGRGRDRAGPAVPGVRCDDRDWLDIGRTSRGHARVQGRSELFRLGRVVVPGNGWSSD